MDVLCINDPWILYYFLNTFTNKLQVFGCYNNIRTTTEKNLDW
jgi:hypothetical protein